MQKIKQKKLGDATVKVALDQLSTATVAKLRIGWNELFGGDPPIAFGPDLLRRSIAQHVQEKAYGGLSPSMRRLLDQMIKATASKPNGQLELPRRIKPGSELVRDWKGKTYRVSVRLNGFAYDSKSYSNLSEIASLITGTNWNGPRFFGLRSKAEGASANGK